MRPDNNPSIERPNKYIPPIPWGSLAITFLMTVAIIIIVVISTREDAVSVTTSYFPAVKEGLLSSTPLGLLAALGAVLLTIVQFMLLTRRN